MTKVIFEGKEYTLTQEAYIDGSQDNPVYKAIAVDVEGNEYEVTWDVVENWEEVAERGDESLMCDWDNPVEVTEL